MSSHAKKRRKISALLAAIVEWDAAQAVLWTFNEDCEALNVAVARWQEAERALRRLARAAHPTEQVEAE